MSRIDSHKSSSPLLGARYIINIESDMHMFSNELKYLVSAGPAVSILRESLQLRCSVSCCD